MKKSPGLYSLGQIIYHNPPVQEVPITTHPKISENAVVGVNSMIIGDVTVSADVFIGFHNIIRSDSSYPFYIGRRTNIQDFVLIHCHPAQFIKVPGRKMGVYIEEEVSILHHAAPHGPLFIGKNTFIGQHVSIYGATIGRNCVVMHGAVITNHVKIGDNRFVAPGQSVYTQDQADALPEVPHQFKNLNQEIVDHYYRLGKSYKMNTPLAF
ncbi:DapH/DapD/GlmU-related protein [Aneurinibacillus terranovensis]|uniref:DapH/DapD/GlmU-related protein n=1 Tax=Aneurinibacillus terranovensis TaxID=278991 RepID=UPI00040FFE71|nr:DapH/DapD/GlmU-related protein [Aneurinibacillus terranovensis]